MDWIRILVSRCAGFFARARLDDDLEEELQSHIDLAIDENLKQGMSQQQARTAALRRFGGVAQTREQYRAQRGLPFLEAIWHDLKFGVRHLRKSPSFTIAAVMTLALGIGANLTVFLILYGVLLRPLPFPQPQQLVRINRFYPVLHDAVIPAYSGTKVLFFRRVSRTIESAAAYDYVPMHVNLVRGDQVVPLDAMRATSDFFHVFRMEPKMGRGFLSADMAPSAPGVAVLSDAAWRQQFAADPGVLGRFITLGNQSYNVVGVANPAFRLSSRVDVWMPLQVTENPKDQSNMYNFVGRLKPGVTISQAQDDLRHALLQMKSIYPDLWNRNESVRVLDLHDSLVGQMRPALELLMGAVGLVLVIVSANILSLLLTRSIARRRETSLRAALGATRWRILRLLLVENAVLCMLGGASAVLLARFATPALLRLSPLPLPQFVSLHIGVPALLFTFGLVLVCALLFSLVPAIESSRTQLNESLRMNSAQVAGGRNLPQRSLVVAEVAVSLVLMVAAGLLLTSFWKLVHVAPGFDTHHVLTFKTSFSAEQATSSASFGQRLNEIAARLEAQPGVEAAAAVNTLPTQITPTMPFEILGPSAGNGDPAGSEDYMPITAHYFRALRIPVMAGRSFRSSDAAGTHPVIIINEPLAQTYFKGENPIGRHIRIGAVMGPGFEDKVREIVGIVGDTKNAGLDLPAPPMMYLPQAQIPDPETQMEVSLLGVSWVVRTRGGLADSAAAARRVFMEDAHIPLLSVETMPEVISASLAQQRFTMTLLACFGLISLLMGATGLYGVMSYTVARRTREIGVRMALGAYRGDILRMVLREAWLLIAVGLAVGLCASLASAQLLRSLLFGVIPRDPVMLAAMCGVLMCTGLFAAWWPARRAASTEPVDALRME
jgi:predicted permease